MQKGVRKGVRKDVRKDVSKDVRKDGREEGHEEGHLLTLREMTLDAIAERFHLSGKQYRAIEKRIVPINDEQTLRSLFTLVLRAATLEAFEQGFAQATGMQTKEQ